MLWTPFKTIERIDQLLGAYPNNPSWLFYFNYLKRFRTGSKYARLRRRGGLDLIGASGTGELLPLEDVMAILPWRIAFECATVIDLE